MSKMGYYSDNSESLEDEQNHLEKGFSAQRLVQLGTSQMKLLHGQVCRLCPGTVHLPAAVSACVTLGELLNLSEPQFLSFMKPG